MSFNNSKKLSFVMSANSQTAYSAYKRTLDSYKNHSTRYNNEQTNRSVISPKKDLGPLYQKKTHVCTKPEHTIKTSGNDLRSSFVKGENRNMPFSLKEARFQWQTDYSKSEVIAYENKHKTCIKTMKKYQEKTNTIDPKKIPLYKENYHIKVDYENNKRNTASLVDITRRDKDDYMPKYSPPKKEGNPKNYTPIGIDRFLKNTPDYQAVPIKGKKRINPEFQEKPDFVPSKKLDPYRSVFKSKFSGPSLLPLDASGNDGSGFKKLKTKRNNSLTYEEEIPKQSNNGFTRFQNKKNQSSVIAYQDNKPQHKRFYKQKSAEDLLVHNANNKYIQEEYGNTKSFLNNKKNVDRKNNEVFNSSAFDFADQKHKRTAKQDGVDFYKNFYDPEIRQMRKAPRKLSTSVIDFRYRSNFDLRGN